MRSQLQRTDEQKSVSSSLAMACTSSHSPSGILCRLSYHTRYLMQVPINSLPARCSYISRTRKQFPIASLQYLPTTELPLHHHTRCLRPSTIQCLAPHSLTRQDIRYHHRCLRGNRIGKTVHQRHSTTGSLCLSTNSRIMTGQGAGPTLMRGWA